jgi:hypothetical protein
VRELAAGKGFGFAFPGTAHLQGLDEPLSLFSLRLAPEPLSAEPAPTPARRQTWLLATRGFVNELRPRWFSASVYTGFPLAIVLARDFDVTDQGVRRTRLSARRSTAIKSLTDD